MMDFISDLFCFMTIVFMKLTHYKMLRQVVTYINYISGM